MTIMKHELKRGRTALAIWTLSISFLLAVCIFIFPEMKGDMDSFGDAFASMGSFTDAFGMDKLNFGTLVGFYAIECGNVLGLGGAFFAAFIAVSALAKEEKERTSEFLLAHPVSRVRIITEKFVAVMLQILILNVVVYAVAVVSIIVIDEPVEWKEITLLHLANLIAQIELASICFGISAFIKHGSIGIGLGVAITMYFLNLIANMSESAKDLKYVTPFGYTDGAYIVENGTLDTQLILIGAVIAVISVLLAYLKYTKKDIA